VLVIDADPQANLTARLGVEVNEHRLTLADVLAQLDGENEIEEGEDYLGDAITHAGPKWSDLLGVVPSELGLARQEKVTSIGAEFRLRTALTGLQSTWDDILIDCPPSLGLLTLNAMIAADQVVAVTEAAALPVEGLAYMIRTLGSVRRHYNPNLSLVGVVINKLRTDRLDRAAWAEKLRASYGELVIDPTVPEREIVSQANSAALPLAALGRATPAVVDVRAAMDAIADRIVGLDQ
jgi:chromosome partitioning protein